MENALGLFIYTFAAFGLAYIVGHAIVTRSIREWLFAAATFEEAVELHWMLRVRRVIVTLIECPACLGFWIGLVFGFNVIHLWWTAIAGALYTAGTNFCLAHWTGLMNDDSTSGEG